jgi:excisionase family DNA binding protein
MSYHKHTKTKISERTRVEDLPEYLTPYEVCQFTRRCRMSVYKAIKKGTIPSIRVGERGFLVPASHFREQQAPARAVQP